MDTGTKSSAKDVAALPEDLDSARLEILTLRGEVASLRQLAEEQREQLRIMKARQFGRSSEKLTGEDLRQGRLFNEAEERSAPPADPEAYEQVRVRKTTYTRKKPGRTRISSKLARVEVVVDLGEEEKRAVPEGYELARIGEETSEQVHEIPQKYVVIRTVRPKYVVKPVAGSGLPKLAGAPSLLIAPAPARILPRSIATPSLLSSVLTGKFCDALPFYRQERMFLRFGLEISRQDMANWTMAVAERLGALMALMKTELLSGPCLHSDETFFQVMDEEGRENTSTSYMWVLTGGSGSRRVVLYHYNATREASFISGLLASYSGFLQTDGYQGYAAIGEKDGITHVACWAHARRRFVEAHEAAFHKGAASEAIAQIGRIYDIERDLRMKHFGPESAVDYEAFAAERRLKVEPLLAELKAWLAAKALEILPKSALGKAISYTIDLWPRLVRYLDCPFLTPDNNEAERGIRPFTVGRKNWVISGSPRGASASAALYSVIETIKANELEPYYALRHILTKLPVTPDDRLPELLPWNIDKAAFQDIIAEDARLSLSSTALE